MNPKEYDGWFSTPFGRYADDLEKELIFRFLGNVRGKRILDVGCGTGNYSILLAKMGADVFGIDSSKEMIIRARKKAEKENVAVKFHIGKAELLPFNSRSFDIVLSVTACEFLSNIQKAADEMKRVMKKNGRIILGLINRHSLYCVGKKISARFRKDSVYGRAHFYTPQEIERIFGGIVRWKSALFAQEWFPPFLLGVFSHFEKPLSKILKRFGAFIAMEIKK